MSSASSSANTSFEFVTAVSAESKFLRGLRYVPCSGKDGGCDSRDELLENVQRAFIDCSRENVDAAHLSVLVFQQKSRNAFTSPPGDEWTKDNGGTLYEAGKLDRLRDALISLEFAMLHDTEEERKSKTAELRESFCGLRLEWHSRWGVKRFCPNYKRLVAFFTRNEGDDDEKELVCAETAPKHKLLEEKDKDEPSLKRSKPDQPE